MSKTTDIVAILTRELSEGKYPAGSLFPSEYDLVRRFDVNRSTANKAVLSLVTAGLLIRGVRGAGTRVANKQPHSKGRIIFLGSILHPNEVKKLQGTLVAAQARGYSLELSMPSEQTLKNGYLAQLGEDTGTIGIITVGYSILFDEYCPNLPVIYLDMADPRYYPDKHYIATPNEEAAGKMMEALLAKGHREIIVYASPQYRIQHNFYRVKGFLDTMKAAGIADADNRLFPAMDYTNEDATETLKKILQHFPKTTAIVTTSDDIVRTMLQAMKNLGIPHPGSITLTGFGNLLDVCTPNEIPTVEQNHLQFGVQACTSLIDFHEGRFISIPHIQYIGYKMVNMEFIPNVMQR